MELLVEEQIMYKATQDSHDYLSRTGNHSTKGSRKGYCNTGVIVDEADLVDDPGSVRVRLLSVMGNARCCRLQIEEKLLSSSTNVKNWRRNIAYKYKGREHLFTDIHKKNVMLREYFQLGDIIEDCASKLSKIRVVTHADIRNEFMNAAKDILDHDLFHKILNKAGEMATLEINKTR